MICCALPGAKGLSRSGAHDTTLPLARTQVAREVLPRPRDTGAQRLDGHALDEEEELHERLAVRLAAGRDCEPAVTHDDGGDAVPRRGARLRVPEELAVVVGMDVDEAGGEGEARAVDLAGAVLGDAPDGRYAVAGDGEVAACGLAAAAITEERAPDDEVGHRGSCSGSGHPPPRAAGAGSTGPRPPSGVALAPLRGHRGLRAAALEVAPRELGAEDRLVARRERKGRRHELPHAHQGARDDHAETLGEAERDTLAVAARAALGDDVARHLEDGGRHAYLVIDSRLASVVEPTLSMPPAQRSLASGLAGPDN